jgi:YVTN family beta-propeller protein
VFGRVHASLIRALSRTRRRRVVAATVLASIAAAIAVAAVSFSSGSLGASSNIAPLAPLTLKTSGEPFGIAIDAQSGRAYVTDSKENTLFVFEVATGKAVAYVPTGRQPTHVVLIGERAYVSNFTDASITVIDTSRNRPLRTLSIGGLGLAVNRETQRLYAAAGSRVFVLDTTTDKLVATIAAPFGANLWGIAVDPATNRLYATDIASPRVLVYDGATNRLVTQVAIDAPARFGIAVGATGRVFVASYIEKDAQVSVIDGVTARVIVQAPVSALTISLAVDATSGLVYAASAIERTVTSIDPLTRATTAKLSLAPTVAQTPGGLAINPGTGALILVTSGGAAPPARPFVDQVPVVKP